MPIVLALILATVLAAPDPFAEASAETCEAESASLAETARETGAEANMSCAGGRGDLRCAMDEQRALAAQAKLRACAPK